MQTTSHFVGIQLNPEVFSDLFIKVFKYLEKNNIENILVFQNILSLHITLYYFEANLSKFETKKIQEKISKLDKNFIINLGDLKYFERGENKIIGYLNGKSNKNLETIFNEFNAEFQRKEIFENNLKFIPHITLFKIKNSEIYDKYKENIEKLIDEEIKKIKEIDIFTGEIFLYKVNSNFFGEIQIKT